MRPHLQEEHALRHVLRAVQLLDVGVELLQALFHGAQVREDELQLEHPRVPHGIDGAVGMRRQVGLEGAHDMDEGVDTA